VGAAERPAQPGGDPLRRQCRPATGPGPAAHEPHGGLAVRVPSWSCGGDGLGPLPHACVGRSSVHQRRRAPQQLRLLWHSPARRGLFAFTSHLLRAKRGGLREYGLLANRYVREFDHKWLGGGAAPDEALVGSADIQSLADLANSFDVVRTMRGYPFSRDTVFFLAAATLLPVLPLTLTMIPLEQLIDRLLGVIF